MNEKQKVEKKRTKTKTPTVSVIVPVYNAEKYVSVCMDSILAQTYTDFEVLCFNDGSSDGSLKILRDYEKKDKRVKVIDQKNMGVAKTRNKAVGQARGEFVAFMDNDDFVDSDYLERLLPRKGEDVVISGYRRPDQDGIIKTEVRLDNEYWSRFVVVAPWAKIYRKDFIVKNKLEFLDNNIGEDVYFNLLAMLTARNVRVLDYVGYNWFINDKSVSNTKQRTFDGLDVMFLLDSCYEQLDKRNILKDNYDVVELYFYRYIVWFLLFASKGQNRRMIGEKYDELFVWLEERFPNYKNNKLLKRGKLPGEMKVTRIAYEVFLRFHKMGLGKMLVAVYAKV